MGTLKISTFLFFVFILYSNFSEGQSNDSKNDSIGYLYEPVIVEAEFPGGFNSWISFLSKNLNSYLPGDRGCPPGRYQVIIKFIVNKEGNIDTIIPETHNGFGMEQEVIRVIKLSPKWNPALQNGRPVKAFKRQTFMFVVDPDKEEKGNQN